MARSLLRLPFDCLVYGPTYGLLNHLIGVPEPLDADRVWALVNRPFGRGIDWIRRHYPPEPVRRLLVSRWLGRKHAVGLDEHYSIPQQFYWAMLDERFRFYSAGDFEHPTDTLEEAQTRKADAFLALLEPKAGQRILDLGCGWGGMMKRIADETGDADSLHGCTLTHDHFEHVRQQFPFDVSYANFITMDCGQHAWDAIYSIETWEHVRPAEIRPLLAKLWRALEPGGRLVKQFFCLREEGLPVSCLAGQLCFPGSQLSSLAFHRESFEQAGFQIVQELDHDYRPTLRAWFDRLVQNRSRAIAAGGVRRYNRHLVFLAATSRFFGEGEAVLKRFVLRKPDSG